MIACALVACKGATHDAESSPTPVKPPAHDAAPSTVGVPTSTLAHAKHALDIEVAGIKSGDSKPTLALFDTGSIALAGSAHKTESDSLITTLGRLNPHDSVADIKVAKLVIGGNDSVAWLMADLAITKKSQEPGGKSSTVTTIVHTTEVLSAAADWKIVAAAFAEAQPASRRNDMFPMLKATGDAGPLAGLLAAPATLASALAADANVVVVSNDTNVAVGADAGRALLAPWNARKLSVNGKVREVHTDKLGFVQANIDWNEPGGDPYRFMAQLIALPKPDGTWSVVAVQFLAL